MWVNPIFDYETLGASLHLGGKLVIEFYDFEYYLFDVQQDTLIPTTSLICEDCGYIWKVGNMAYDMANNRYVVIFQEGRIQMYYLDWTAPPTPSVSKDIVIARGVKRDWQTIYAAEFDPLGRYLAIARGNKLKILEVKEKTARKKIEINANNVTDLMFDQTGALLFIASEDKIIVLDVFQKRIITEHPAPKITTFDISSDNRLLIWGDQSGVIHVWGIRK